MYTIRQIAVFLNAPSRITNDAAAIGQLLTDSRKLVFPETTLFFALVTPQRDAHLFIAELYDRGTRNFVVNKNFDAGSFANANFIFVDDTLAALQTLASIHRRQFQYPVIAITGSNGKTIVKEWLYQLLSPDFNIVRSPRSYNSQTGVPLSVWQMSHDFNLAIFEAGISMPGEMQHLAGIIQPTIGVFTNIGNAHEENFKSAEQKIQEKCRLFQNCDAVILNGDNSTVTATMRSASKARLLTWGENKNNEIIILKRRSGNETLVEFSFQQQTKKIIIPFTDEASVQNVITCIVCLVYFKVDFETISERVQNLQPVDMRLQLAPAINNSALINDSYSFDIVSFSVALDFMQQQNQFTNKTVILSDVPGTDSAERYEEIISMLKARAIKRAIVIGGNWKKHLPVLQTSISEVEGYATTRDFLDKFLANHFRNEIILLKGARKFGFENIAAALQQKVHRTVMEINLTSVIHNLNAYRQILKPGVQIMAMVKASGYGSGSAEIANVLQYHKAGYLAVAYADEGVELRKANIRLPVMVMNVDEDAFEQVIQYNLEPEIYSLSILKSFDAFLNKQGLQLYPVHIKIDTGMHRLGFGPDEIEALISILKNSNRMVVRSVFSHLVASEDPAEDDFTQLQSDRLTAACNQIEPAIGYRFLKHISNSAAAIRKPELQFDMIRLGIGLFGIDPTGLHQLELKPAISLKTTIAQIRKLKPGETVGYNRRGKITTDSVMATLRIGYADGLRRVLSNGAGKVFINGQLAPITGTIAMDMAMADITHIPGVKEGDEVEIFGAHISIEEVAASCGTIPYEILTGVSQRVKRVYIEE
jgi:alanine racemase